MMKFGFIGMGNMGYAMLKGALNSFSSDEIIFTCPSSQRREYINSETNVAYAESNAECANNSKYIILAVKPQVYDVVLKNIHDIVPYTIVDGMPAKAIGLNSVGIARAGISPSIRKNIKQAYRLLYRSGYSLPEAIAAIEQEVESSEEIEYLLKFLREADRGICRANRINKKSLFDGDSSEE